MAGPLNTSSNVLLVYRLQEMRSSANVNFVLALLCLAYCGINITLIYVTYFVSKFGQEKSPVTEQVYHLLEFWATFGFAVVECVSLVSTPKSLSQIYDRPLVLKLILFFNIVATLLPAVLVTLNLEFFEIVSHQVEYANELTLSFVDLVLLSSLVRLDESPGKNNKRDERQYGLFVMSLIAGLVALIQLTVYNSLGRTPDGDMAGEVPAHFLEFLFETFSSIVAFWFCMDNRFVAEKEIGRILYGRHDQCGICDSKSLEFQQTYLERTALNGGRSASKQTYGSMV